MVILKNWLIEKWKCDDELKSEKINLTLDSGNSLYNREDSLEECYDEFWTIDSLISFLRRKLKFRTLLEEAYIISSMSSFHNLFYYTGIRT